MLTLESMEQKTKTISDFRVHERDTGSADVQIALLTQRINQLTEHLQKIEDRIDRLEKTVGAAVDLLHAVLHPDKVNIPGNPTGR